MQASHLRHGRACPGHPRGHPGLAQRYQMPGYPEQVRAGPGMTVGGQRYSCVFPGHNTRLSPVVMPFPLSVSLSNQGSFPPPALPGLRGTTSPSATLPARPAPRGVPVGMCAPPTGLPVLLPPPSSMVNVRPDRGGVPPAGWIRVSNQTVSCHSGRSLPARAWAATAWPNAYLPCVPPPLPRRNRPVRMSLTSRPVAAFPEKQAGRLPHYAFRGLLGVHSRCGPYGR